MKRDLVILSGEQTGSVVPLTERTVVGRSEEADLRLPDAMVSMEHCELRSGAGGLTLRDLGSTNGVLVNGRSLREGQLFHGDVLQVGAVSLLVRAPERRPDEAEVTSRRADRRVTMVKVGDLPPGMAQRDLATPPADEAFFVLHLINVLDVGRTMALSETHELAKIVATKVRYAVGADRCEVLYVCDAEGGFALRSLDGRPVACDQVPAEALEGVLAEVSAPLTAWTGLDGEAAGLIVPVLPTDGVQRLVLFVERPVAHGAYSAFERSLLIAVAVTMATPLAGEGPIRTRAFHVLRGGE